MNYNFQIFSNFRRNSSRPTHFYSIKLKQIPKLLKFPSISSQNCIIFSHNIKYNNYQYIQIEVNSSQNIMSYSRQDIQNIIARNKKRRTSKSPSPPLSHKSIEMNRSISPKDMALRYQEICTKYKELLQGVRDKNHKFQMQQAQLSRLRAEKERDEKQLYRLRLMIGFIKKEDKGLQVNMEMQSGGSWSTKMQKSTTIENPIEFQYNTPVKNSQSAKVLRKISPHSKEMNYTIGSKGGFKTVNFNEKQYESQFYKMKAENIYSPKGTEKPANTFFKVKQNREFQSRLNKLSNSPYSKLRFSRKIDHI